MRPASPRTRQRVRVAAGRPRRAATRRAQARSTCARLRRGRGSPASCPVAKLHVANIPTGNTVDRRAVHEPARGAASSPARSGRSQAAAVHTPSAVSRSGGAAAASEEKVSAACAARPQASVAIASAPPATQWSPWPVKSCRTSKRESTTTYASRPSPSGTRDAQASHAARSLTASRAARTASDSVATTSRKELPVVGVRQRWSTTGTSASHRQTASARRAPATGDQPSATARAPTAAVPATQGSATGEPAPPCPLRRSGARPRMSARARATHTAAAPPTSTSATTRSPSATRSADRCSCP